MFAMMVMQWCESAGMPCDGDLPSKKLGSWWVIRFALRSTNLGRWHLFLEGVFNEL
jgi:hypothetical protein